jgi:sugar lactone lactonase YvrE
LVLALEDGIHAFEWDESIDEYVLPIESDHPMIRLNDAKCDPHGRLWVGTMSSDFREGVSTLYRVGPDEAVPVLTGCSLPNGFGWNPEGTRMYFIDSLKRRIDVLRFDADTGTATERQPWVSIDEALGHPDGMTVDEDGFVWVALYGSGQVVRYDPDGVAVDTLKFPVRKVTSVCFGGDELNDLYVTSAKFGLSATDLESEPFAGATFIVSGAGHGQRTVPWDTTTLSRLPGIRDHRVGGTHS